MAPIPPKRDAWASPGSPGPVVGPVLQRLVVEQPAVCNLLAGEGSGQPQPALIGLGKGAKAKRAFFFFYLNLLQASLHLHWEYVKDLQNQNRMGNTE